MIASDNSSEGVGPIKTNSLRSAAKRLCWTVDQKHVVWPYLKTHEQVFYENTWNE